MIRVTVDKSDESFTRCQGCHDRPGCTTIEIGEYPNPARTRVHLCDECLTEMRGKLFPMIDRAETGAKVGRRHPVQAKDASSRVKIGSRMASLLAIVARHDAVGATCAQAQPQLSDVVEHHVSRNNTAAVMLALRERGLVEPAKTATGEPLLRETEWPNQGQVWILSDVGRTELDRLAGIHS